MNQTSESKGCGRCRALDLVVAEKDSQISSLKGEVEELKNGSLWIQKVKQKNSEIADLQSTILGLRGEFKKIVSHKPSVLEVNGYFEFKKIAFEALASTPTRLEESLGKVKESLEELIDTAGSYAMQTYNRSGCTKKQIELGRESLATLNHILGEKR
jgi:hypothetical protein